MKFRPCIDLHNGKVKQIVGGTLQDSNEGLIENFISDKDAAYYGALYKKDNLPGGHVIKLGPGNDTEALNALKAYPGGLQIGGGINPDNALGYLDAGASHVIVTSYVFKDGSINFKNLGKLVKTVGKERIVIDLSCRKRGDNFYVVTDRWQKFTDFEITEENFQRLSSYCDEFLVHAADVEGQCKGVQKEIISILAQWTEIPVTYAGGVHTMDDLQLVKNLGNGIIDLTIGSALDIFGGSLSYEKVVQWFENQG